MAQASLANTVIQAENVTKSFGGCKALDGVDLSVQKGQIYGFLGPNGAGKTTMIRCLMDYIAPSEGAITILGQDAHTNSAPLKRDIGYLSSDMQLNPGWTAATHIGFMGSIKGRGRAEQLVKEFNLDLDTKVRKLSSGNKQKLAIILAFLGSPRVLIMDEPTRGLDPLLQNHLYALLKSFAAEGGTVFFSSHNLAEVQRICTSVAVIRQGKIVASEAMADILKMQIHLVRVLAKTPITPTDFKLKGVEVLEHNGAAIHLKVRGRIDPVIRALARYDLSDLEVSHASLEDVFMEYY